MEREERWRMKYQLPDGTVKTCVSSGKEKKLKNENYCREHGFKILSVKKLYPFSTNKNQHNFELINNICYNTMWDMEHNEIPYDNEEYNRLYDLHQKAEKYFCYPLPVAWVPWEEYREMKELSSMAILHRQEACIANGRPDLVTYC